MSEHNIDIRKKGAGRTAKPGETAIATGDKVTFTAAADAASILCFSAETATALSAPPRIDLAGGDSAVLTVGALVPQEYIVVIQAHGWPAPTQVKAGKTLASAKLILQDAAGKDFPDPPDPPVNSGDGSGTDGGNS